MKVYAIIQKDITGDRLIAIFMNKHIAECFIDDFPELNDFKLIELKGEEID